MFKPTSKFIQMIGGIKMKNQDLQQIEETNCGLQERGYLKMNIQDKLTALKQHLMVLTDNCNDFIRSYDGTTGAVGNLKFVLACNNLELEQREELEEKLEPMVKSQKENAKEYKRAKLLINRIQGVLRSIYHIELDHEYTKRLKAQVDNQIKELRRVQQTIENLENQFKTSVQKIEMQLDDLWNISNSDEFKLK
ncbi:hypothetical protein [Desulfosporosinus sp. SB140]|uniref:hypothetical protein n=1 Tax=Desulfosporosinus paludis TaxID=3115649 RepID=UPI003890642A